MVRSSSRFSRINQYSLKLMYLTSLLSSDTQAFVLNRPFWPFFQEPKRNSRIRTKPKPNPNPNKYTFNHGRSFFEAFGPVRIPFYEKIWTVPERTNFWFCTALIFGPTFGPNNFWIKISDRESYSIMSVHLRSLSKIEFSLRISRISKIEATKNLKYFCGVVKMISDWMAVGQIRLEIIIMDIIRR